MSEGKFIKQGRVVILLGGRMAGKKAIIVKTFDEGSKARPFGHALVAGVEKPPQKVTRKMGKKKVAKRTRIQTFVKYVNYTHMMPTRYTTPTEIGVGTMVSDSQMENQDGRAEARKTIRKVLQEKFVNPIMEKEKPSAGMVFLSKKLKF